MKKKNLFTLMLVALLAFSLGMGTLAYYTKTFASNDNIVRAAKFTVDSGGSLDENVEFDLRGDPLIPGETRDIYEFEIHKNDTEVPVNYGVTVKGRQRLFDENSPVRLNLYKMTGEKWNLYDGAAFLATEDIEKFKIEAVWLHGNNDIAYQNATGMVAIKVVATQADGTMPVDPVDPDPDPEPIGPRIDATYYFKPKPGLDAGAFLTINVENVEGATRARVRYISERGSLVTSNPFELGQKFKMAVTADIMPQAIEVLVFGQDGTIDASNALHIFENITPTIVTP